MVETFWEQTDLNVLHASNLKLIKYNPYSKTLAQQHYYPEDIIHQIKHASTFFIFFVDYGVINKEFLKKVR